MSSAELTVSTISYRAWFHVKHSEAEDDFLDRDAAGRLMTDQAGDGLSTASYAVFSKAVQTTVTALPTSAVISVADAGLFTVDDQVEVVKDDNVALIENVDAVDANAGTITLNSTPSPQLTVGSSVRKIYGAPGSQRVAMEIGGATPRVGSQDWYWHALGDPNVFSDLVPGLEVEIESIVQKSGGTLINSIKRKCVTIEAECA